MGARQHQAQQQRHRVANDTLAGGCDTRLTENHFAPLTTPFHSNSTEHLISLERSLLSQDTLRHDEQHGKMIELLQRVVTCFKSLATGSRPVHELSRSECRALQSTPSKRRGEAAGVTAGCNSRRRRRPQWASMNSLDFDFSFK